MTAATLLPSPGAPAGQCGSARLDHRAVLYAGYGGPRGLLAGAAPFLHDALDQGSAPIVVTTTPATQAIRTTLGATADQVTFVAAEDLYIHPVRALAAYDRLVRRRAPDRVWVLAEPLWHGLTPSQTAEWMRYEAVVNAAFAASGARVACLYDTGRLPADILQAARRTHPILSEGSTPLRSPAYQDPRAYCAELARAPLPGPPVPPVVLPLAEGQRDFHKLRRRLADHATAAGMAAPAGRLMLMAVSETAANAARHGTGPMQARTWAADGQMIVEVIDYGHWKPDPLLGYLPPEPGLGFGMWGVRLLADGVEVRTGWAGTTVRLAFNVAGARR
jgi:anti-sigma regulatory factor (Ser/Thr protein kinase)